jgi:hypothetical protein
VLLFADVVGSGDPHHLAHRLGVNWISLVV